MRNFKTLLIGAGSIEVFVKEGVKAITSFRLGRSKVEESLGFSFPVEGFN